MLVHSHTKDDGMRKCVFRGELAAIAQVEEELEGSEAEEGGDEEIDGVHVGP
jgi:hypothetical protein